MPFGSNRDVCAVAGLIRIGEQEQIVIASEGNSQSVVIRRIGQSRMMNISLYLYILQFILHIAENLQKYCEI